MSHGLVDLKAHAVCVADAALAAVGTLLDGLGEVGAGLVEPAALLVGRLVAWGQHQFCHRREISNRGSSE